jgi:hypothetical protein
MFKLFSGIVRRGATFVAEPKESVTLAVKRKFDRANRQIVV